MNEKLDIILEQIKSLTLLEATKLVAAIEETFGIDASVATAPIQAGGAGVTAIVAEVAEEKTSFNIYLEEVPTDKKIPILKIIRNVTGLGLKESKEIVDNVPKLVKEVATKEDSENIKKELESAGAKVSIK